MVYEHIEYIISIFIFIFGIITWIPFLKTPYSQDQSATACLVEQVLKKKITFFKDKAVYTIGHFLPVIIIQYFFGKDNKYYNWLMCIWCSLSACIIYWITYDLFGLTTAVIAGVLFALYIVNPRIDGNWGPSETILALPLLVSLFLILRSSGTDSYALITLSGLFFGYSILIKQTAIMYLPGYLLMIMGMNMSLTSLCIFGVSAFISNLIPLIYYWRKDAFWEYLACNWLMMLPSAVNPKKYNKYYPRTLVKSAKDSKTKKKVIVRNSLSLFPMTYFAIICLVSIVINHNFSLFHLGLFMCLLASICMVFMRGTYFPHYWLYMVPWLVITASYSISETISILSTGLSFNLLHLHSITILFGLFAFIVYLDYKFYIPHKDPYGFIRMFYGENFVNNNYKNPVEIGRYIKNTTNPEDKILVCGHTPDIILYSDRSSFCPDICLDAEDYVEIYSKSNPTLLGFLNDIYKFKSFKIIKQKENIFKSGFPEIIVFSDGRGDIKDFEKLTGMCYSIDEKLKGYPLHRADRELTELMSMYGKTNTERLPSEESINLKKNDLIGSVNKQDWNTALETTKHLLATAPQNRELLSILGDCLIRLDNFKLLFGFYNRLIGEKSTSVRMKLELLNKLGVAYCCLNKLSEAETLFKKILGAKPDNPVVLSNLGYVYNKQNKVGEAVECFQKSLKIDPNNADAIHNLGQIKAQHA